jgi:predicted ATP-dependent endonuclease of OLD family
MRLVSVRIEGYKRFASDVVLYVNRPVLAVVGPNEAGKTSLLRALEHLSKEGAFERRELTDREQDWAQWVVSARFALESEDLEATREVLPARANPSFTLGKQAGGDWRGKLNIELHRDMAPRERALKQLAGVLQRGLIGELQAEDPQEEPLVEERARSLEESLTSDEENLSGAVREEIRGLAREIEGHLGETESTELRKLVSSLDELASAEDHEHPQQQAERILRERTPQFLFFDEGHRTLLSEYRWDEHPEAPAALTNLFSLAGTSYQHFRDVATDPDRRDQLNTITTRANAALQEHFKAWSQNEISVALFPTQEVLEIHIKDLQTEVFVRLDERSDGLRIFVALIAFTARYATQEQSRPILLIDEAEAHLHYGAQADLVKVFERQQAAQLIIYTTHSVGCLPEDLGSTLRVVEPIAHERSRVRNSAWSGTIGVSPLILAMGANVLAFTPARFAVIGEGATEAILLPTLLREARGQEEAGEPLGFQVVPGVAEVDETAAEELELEAASVVYLIDADPGGRQHRRKLPSRAKDEGRVIELGNGKEPGLCTEDFVDAKSLATAFNSVVENTRPEISERLQTQDLPDVGRGSILDDWCRDRGQEPVSKTLVAQAVLDLARDGSSIVEQRRISQLRMLHKKLLKALRPRTRPRT